MEKSNFINPSNHVDAVFLNTRSRGGAGKYLWKQFLDTEYALKYGFNKAKIFNIAKINNPIDILDAARSWAEECIQKGCRRFVAAGGDGTVHIAINSLHSLNNFLPCLGAIGIGSSNDFHKPNHYFGRSLINGIPCRLDFDSAFKHDLGEVEYSLEPELFHKELFVINSSIGFTAQANEFFNCNNRFLRFVKRISVHSAIFITIIKEFFNYKKIYIQIIFNNMEQIKTNLINLGIVKNPNFAGNFRYDIHQYPDDGLFGVYLYGTRKNSKTSLNLKWKIIKTFSSLINGTFSKIPGVISKKCEQISIHSSYPIALEIDGEIKKITQANFRILPKELFICP